MRSIILMCLIVMGVCLMPVAPAAASGRVGTIEITPAITTSTVGITAGPSAREVSHFAVAQNPQPPAQINVEVNRGGRAWYLSPVWIAIGVIGVILLVVIVAMIARGGGGTTVIRG